MSDWIESAAKILRALPCRCTDDKELDELRSREAIRELDAAGFLKRPTDRDGWMPIESAPKDGTRIILYVPIPKMERRVKIGSWRSRNNKKTWVFDGGLTILFHPTHWRPLPSAPTPEAK